MIQNKQKSTNVNGTIKQVAHNSLQNGLAGVALIITAPLFSIVFGMQLLIIILWETFRRKQKQIVLCKQPVLK